MASSFPQCYNTSSGTHPWLQPECPAGRLEYHHGENPQGNSRAGGQGVALPRANVQSRDQGLPTLLLVLAGSLQPHSLLPLLCRAPKLGVPAALRKPQGEHPSTSSAELQRFVLSPGLSSEAFSALPKPKLILLQQLPSCAAQRQPCCLPAPSSPRGTGAKTCPQPSPHIPGDHPAPRRGCSGLGFSAAC